MYLLICPDYEISTVNHVTKKLYTYFTKSISMLLAHTTEQICLPHWKYRPYCLPSGSFFPYDKIQLIATSAVRFIAVHGPETNISRPPNYTYMPYIWQDYMGHVYIYICVCVCAPNIKSLAWIMWWRNTAYIFDKCSLKIGYTCHIFLVGTYRRFWLHRLTWPLGKPQPELANWCSFLYILDKVCLLIHPGTPTTFTESKTSNFVKFTFRFSANLKQYRTYIMENAEIQKDIHELKTRVEQFARGFSMPDSMTVDHHHRRPRFSVCVFQFCSAFHNTGLWYNF